MNKIKLQNKKSLYLFYSILVINYKCFALIKVRLCMSCLYYVVQYKYYKLYDIVSLCDSL